jgi:hypothetical protein
LRPLVASIAVLVLLLVASQLLLPAYFERRIENRLESDGGSASVTLEALPALRLLAHDGDRLAVDGRGIAVELSVSDLGSRFLEALDGFDEVDVRLTGIRANPFRVESFVLRRDEGGDNYELRMRAATSASEIVAFGSSRLPGLLGPLVGGAGGAFAQRAQIPIDVGAELASDDGRARVVAARGTIAGLQVGPLVELLSAAVLSRI